MNDIQKILNKVEFQSKKHIETNFSEMKYGEKEESDIVKDALIFIIEADIQKKLKVNYQRKIPKYFSMWRNSIKDADEKEKLILLEDDLMHRWNTRNLYIDGKITGRTKLVYDAVYMSILKRKIKANESFDDIFKNIKTIVKEVENLYENLIPLMNLEKPNKVKVAPRYEIGDLMLQGDILVDGTLYIVRTGSSEKVINEAINFVVGLHAVAAKSDKGVDYNSIKVIFPRIRKTIVLELEQLIYIDAKEVVGKLKKRL